jgi:hypothetical protein
VRKPTPTWFGGVPWCGPSGPSGEDCECYTSFYKCSLLPDDDNTLDRGAPCVPLILRLVGLVRIGDVLCHETEDEHYFDREDCTMCQSVTKYRKLRKTIRLP